VAGTGGDPVPTGAILLMASGTCPATYVEETSLDGRMPIGTLTANGDLGTTGGADTLTPAGTINAQTFTGTLASLTHSGANVTSTFTGSAMGTHAHELPFQIATTTTTRQLAAATFGTGTSRAATAVGSGRCGEYDKRGGRAVTSGERGHAGRHGRQHDHAGERAQLHAARIDRSGDVHRGQRRQSLGVCQSAVLSEKLGGSDDRIVPRVAHSCLGLLANSGTLLVLRISVHDVSRYLSLGVSQWLQTTRLRFR
jgi:hypothetical protein